MVRVARFSDYLGYTYPEKVPVVCQSLKFNWAPSILSATLAISSDLITLLAACLFLTSAAQNSVVTIGHYLLIPSLRIQTLRWSPAFWYTDYTALFIMVSTVTALLGIKVWT